MIASVKEAELAEKMIYWTQGSRRRSKETDEPPTHTVGQEQMGFFQSLEPAGLHHLHRGYLIGHRQKVRESSVMGRRGKEGLKGPTGH